MIYHNKSPILIHSYLSKLYNQSTTNLKRLKYSHYKFVNYDDFIFLDILHQNSLALIK